jgi:hypothetical protein
MDVMSHECSCVVNVNFIAYLLYRYLRFVQGFLFIHVYLGCLSGMYK